MRFEACESTSCTLPTDASGRITTSIRPLASGSVTLTAASNIGAVTSTFLALPRIQTVTAASPELFLAHKAVLTWNPHALLSDNGAATNGIAVQWNSVNGPIAFHPTRSFANQQSIAQTTATAGPFLESSQATASACAWSSICSSFTINSISDAALQLSVISGGDQSVDAVTAFSPVIVRVVDPSGHPVAGATVTTHQTLEPWLSTCPSQGRCPIAPIYQTSTATFISGLDGTVLITPLEESGIAETTHLAAAAGTSGFLAFNLRKHR